MANPTTSDSPTTHPMAAADRGTITLITGCMFSGKTTELLRRVRAEEPGRVTVCKHAADDRYDARSVVAHTGDQMAAVALRSPEELLELVRWPVGLVAMDEAHFFGVSPVPVVESLALRGVATVLAALDLDSWGRPFAVVEALRKVADVEVGRKALCACCGLEADRTQRLTPIVGGRMVGGAESYEPRCRACWNPPPESPPD